MSPSKALRLALARAAEKDFGIGLEVRSVAQRKLLHEELAEYLNPSSLMAILEGADGEPGALSVDIQLLAGFVEHQTLGRVFPMPSEGREPTRVDAALIAPLIDDAIVCFRNLLEEEQAPKWLQAYEFGAMTAGPRTLALALTSHEFYFFELEIALEGGAKVGRLQLGFPDHMPIEEHEAEGEPNQPASVEFQHGVLQASTELDAVLVRLKMPITKLQSLAVGQSLTFPEKVLKDTVLETTGREEVARVQFGQINGMRAVRLRGIASTPLQGAENEFIAENASQAPEEALEELLAAETALDAVLPPIEEPVVSIDPLEENLDDLDLDDLLDIGAGDVGDPMALAETPLAGTGV